MTAPPSPLPFPHLRRLLQGCPVPNPGKHGSRPRRLRPAPSRRAPRADRTGSISLEDFCAPYDAPVTLMRAMSEHSRNVRSGFRVGCAALLGLVVGGVVSQYTSWQAAILIGWDAGALFLNAWIWVAVLGLNANESKSHASREDTSVPLSELIILVSGVALLAAVGLVLIRAARPPGPRPG